MKPMRIFTLFVLIMPVLAAAGEIRGFLTEGGKPVPNTVIEIRAASPSGVISTATATTDSSGFFRSFVKETGICTVSLRDRKEYSQAKVFSGERSVQYNLEMTKDKDKGEKYILKTR